MKYITRFEDEDLRKLVIEKYDLQPKQVTSVYTEEVDEHENVTPVFYIEVTQDTDVDVNE